MYNVPDCVQVLQHLGINKLNVKISYLITFAHNVIQPAMHPIRHIVQQDAKRIFLTGF